MTPKHSQMNRSVPKSRNVASGKQAPKSPKRKLDDQDLDEPIYFPYSQCLCDLEKNSHCGCSDHGWDPQSALSHAIAAGKAIYVIDQQTGESVEHLPTCEANPLKKPKHYNPKTIAEDTLRAEGIHPYLPALNEHFVEDTRKAWKQKNDVYENYLRSRH